MVPETSRIKFRPQPHRDERDGADLWEKVASFTCFLVLETSQSISSKIKKRLMQQSEGKVLSGAADEPEFKVHFARDGAGRFLLEEISFMGLTKTRRGLDTRCRPRRVKLLDDDDGNMVGVLAGLQSLHAVEGALVSPGAMVEKDGERARS